MEMTKDRRILIFTALDGDFRLLPIMHYFTHYRRCDEMLSWLINNHLTGKNLNEWITAHFGNSLLSMAKYILKRIDRETEVKPIFYGKDFVHGVS